MKILFDYQIFQQQIYGGISRYFFELIKGIEKREPEISYLLPILQSSNHYIKTIPSIAQGIQSGSDYYNQFLKGINFPGKWRVYQAWRKIFPAINHRNQKLSIRYLQKETFDLFHPTDLDDYFFESLRGRPFVITIHDMIDEYFPEYAFHVDSNYRTSIKEKLILQSAGIIAVSSSTKRDILARFDVDEGKIKVIHHGVSDLKLDIYAERLVREKYLLYVGKRTHYKNFYFFLQCATYFLREDPQLIIVCTGSPFNRQELSYFRDLKVQDRLKHVDADDAILGNLYKHATAFVYPSLYEGFGLPILEAFKYECPVILSNTSSFPEVAGEAGLYFSPKDILSLRDAIGRLLHSPSLRKELINKGSERLKQFSWSKTAAETLSFYKTLID